MREFKIRLGKTLIAFSIVILFLGLSLSIDVNKNQSATIINNYNNDVPSTTIDDSNNFTNGGSSSSGTDSDNNTGIITGNDNTSVVTNPSSSDNVVTYQDLTPSYSVSNNDLRNIIFSTYGVNVKYGIETDGYAVGGYDVISCYDENLINKALLLLQKDMALYPDEFFAEIRKAGLPLTIYLIQNYSSNSITGITEKTRNGVVISISLDYINEFDNTFHHENYHYMEHYIYLRGGGYSNWNNYNPTGFIYGRFDKLLVYNLTFSEDSYFVNMYAESYEYEDRASTFEYMMAQDKITPLYEGKNIWKKAKVMCDTIDYYFTTVNDYTTEYWERFIY